MSRVGKKEIQVPSGVTCLLDDQKISVKGPLGEMVLEQNPLLDVAFEEGKISVTPKNKDKKSRMLWGTVRALLSNYVEGVSNGFTRRLHVDGVGYRASVQGTDLVLSLGYSHEIKYPIPEGIKIVCEKGNFVAISGADKEVVGQVAGEIRALRKPENYKLKGVKYEGEYVLKKEGKKK